MGLLNRLFGDGISDELNHEINSILSSFTLPNMKTDLNNARIIEKLNLSKSILSFRLNWPYPAKSLQASTQAKLSELFCQLDGITQIEIEHRTLIKAHQTQPNVQALPQIKNIIAVGSGKGGVGKSTTSINLALALAEQGARVGVLDADIYGPSLPTLLGLHGKPTSEDGERMSPMQAHGLQAMSIGFLIEEDTPMIWRGPIVTQTLTQLLKETAWDNLDYLIIDLPPGTGDVQLTLAQQIPVTGAVIVTTPQDLALIDAKKAYKMFEKVNIPVLGIIENMSTHICSNCGHEEAIFGEQGGQKMANTYQIPFLGAMPLAMAIRQQADQGKPSMVAEPDGAYANKYREISFKISGQLADAKRNYSAAFPKIVIENS
jgi:ATP-binding protein involved in chromosome partitioning